APYIYNAAAAVTGASVSPSTTTSTTVPYNGTSRYAPSAIISWQTDKPARGKVFYSAMPFTLNETSSPTQELNVGGFVVADDGTYTTSKSVTINNLNVAGGTANPTYYYMVEAIDQNGNVSVT